MKITLTTLVLTVVALVGVCVAVVLPLAGWITKVEVVTRSGLHILMSLCTVVGLIAMVTVIVSTKYSK